MSCRLALNAQFGRQPGLPHLLDEDADPGQPGHRSQRGLVVRAPQYAEEPAQFGQCFPASGLDGL